MMFARDPSAFYLMGRATAALCGVLTVAMLYQVGRKAYSTSAGLLAALFLTVNVLHIDLSRRIGVDVPMVLLATVALYFAHGIVTTGRRTDYLMAALFAALATTTKLPGVLVLLPLLVAHTYNVASIGGGARTWIVSRNLWLAAAVFCAVLIVTNPSIIFVADVLQYTFGSTPDVDDEVAESAIAAAGALTRPNLYVFYFNAMVDSMGWPLMLLGLAGSAYALVRRAPADVMLLSYAAVNYVVIASTNSATLFYPRYALPIIVVLVLLAGRVLAELVQWRGRPHWAVLAAVLAALLVVPARQAGMTAYALTTAGLPNPGQRVVRGQRSRRQQGADRGRQDRRRAGDGPAAGFARSHAAPDRVFPAGRAEAGRVPRTGTRSPRGRRLRLGIRPAGLDRRRSTPTRRRASSTSSCDPTHS